MPLSPKQQWLLATSALCFFVALCPFTQVFSSWLSVDASAVSSSRPLPLMSLRSRRPVGVSTLVPAVQGTPGTQHVSADRIRDAFPVFDQSSRWPPLAAAVKVMLLIAPLAAMLLCRKVFASSPQAKLLCPSSLNEFSATAEASLPVSTTALLATGLPGSRSRAGGNAPRKHIRFAVFSLFEKYTEKAVKVIMLAQEEARKSGHKHVGTEHLLLGMIDEGTGIAAKVLKAHGMDLKATQEEVLNITGVGEGQVDAEISFTPRARKVMTNSEEQARLLGHNYVGTEHLLLGLIKETEGTAAKVIEKMNVDREKIRYETIRMLAEQTKEATLAGVGTTSAKTSSGESRDPTLAEFTINLTEKASKGLLDPVIGRKAEIERVTQILGRRTKNNPCLIGEPGVGKTAIAEGLAQMIVNGDAPETLANKTIAQLDIALLIAGTKYRGEFEERLKRLLDEVKKNDDVILVIDEVHTLVGAGAAEGAIDAANIMKPGLARGELQVIGATTIAEYRKHIEKDAALERRFQPVMVPEPSIDECLQILHGLKPKYEEHHKLKYSDASIEAAVRLASQYISDRFLPDKAIDLLDEAGSRTRLLHGRKSVPEEARELMKELKRLEKEKQEAIHNQDFETASLLRAQETDLEERVKALEEKNKGEEKEEKEKEDNEAEKEDNEAEKEDNKAEKEDNEAEKEQEDSPVVGPDAIASVVASWTGIPVEKVSQAEGEALLNLEAKLHERVVGQNEAVSAIARAIRRARVGLKNPRRPIASFVFLGPTGVGKTELAKALAQSYFGKEDAMIRLDMSEFMERHTVSKLMGSPPGYVGYSEGGQLTQAVRKRPHSLLLFDEVEKAHPDVFNMLLQILDDGRMTDSQGRTVDFKNTVLIMTSNVGSDIIVKGGNKMGFQTGLNEKDQSYQSMKASVQDAMKGTFKPEFLNRIDEIVVFRQLTKEEVGQVADIMIKEVSSLLKEKKVTLNLTPKFKEKLLKEGWNPTLGARPLRRAINTLLEDALAECLLRLDLKEGDTTTVDVDNNGKVVVLDKDGRVVGEKAPVDNPAKGA
eukprot:GGOE01019355.1.p1 GENE.GGOE01019355.1~~GGOE01019355.1.p1  ORF type:complete len:1052 (+),score=348.34 GGOE01019355.1:178-3333(+)